MDFSGLWKHLDISTLVGARYAAYGPLLADALAYFLSQLSATRAREILAAQSTLPADASPALRLVTLLHACPTLHKLGQVVSRARGLDPELRRRLQTLESLEPRTPLSAVRRVIDTDLAAAIDPYRIEVGAAPLAEASVAVVVPIQWSDIGDIRVRDGVLKVIRPGIRERLMEELEILSRVGGYLDERRPAYDLPAFEYRDTFESVRDLLASEIRFDIEQQNLDAARSRYAASPRVHIPRLLPFCSDSVTAMQRIFGAKITDADLSTSQRARLAELIVRALIANPVFSTDSLSLFHADPHAGNLFATPDGDLAILDWSLVGALTRADRSEVARLIAAALTLDAQAIGRAIRALSQTTPDESALRREIDRSLDTVARGALPGPTWLTQLLDRAAACGVRFSGDLLLFRKVLLIIDGVVRDLCPSCSIDLILTAVALERLGREWPERLLAAPGSRQFATHLSNAELLNLVLSAPLTAARWWSRMLSGSR